MTDIVRVAAAFILAAWRVGLKTSECQASAWNTFAEALRTNAKNLGAACTAVIA